MKITRTRVLRFRARASHLDARLASGSLAAAAHGGLQDSIPRAGIIGLHARVDGVEPTSWDDPSLAQVWFRGADYIVPRSDAGVFTLGCSPRDPQQRAGLESLADRVHDVLQGRELKVREVSEQLALEHPTAIRLAAMTGRVLIRWNASMIWLIGCDRPDIDAEDARIELARRFLRWFGPQTKDRLRWWTGTERSDATATWRALEPELVSVDLDGSERWMLEADIDALRSAEPIEGVRLIHNDDPYVKADRELHVADPALRDRVFPPIGKSPGYIPGAVLVDGEIAGVWQRQQRKVGIHPWRKMKRSVVEAIEREALSFPIAGRSSPRVIWD